MVLGLPGAGVEGPGEGVLVGSPRGLVESAGGMVGSAASCSESLERSSASVESLLWSADLAGASGCLVPWALAGPSVTSREGFGRKYRMPSWASQFRSSVPGLSGTTLTLEHAASTANEHRITASVLMWHTFWREGRRERIRVVLLLGTTVSYETDATDAFGSIAYLTQKRWCDMHVFPFSSSNGQLGDLCMVASCPICDRPLRGNQTVCSGKCRIARSRHIWRGMTWDWRGSWPVPNNCRGGDTE